MKDSKKSNTTKSQIKEDSKQPKITFFFRPGSNNITTAPTPHPAILSAPAKKAKNNFSKTSVIETADNKYLTNIQPSLLTTTINKNDDNEETIDLLLNEEEQLASLEMSSTTQTNLKDDSNEVDDEDIELLLYVYNYDDIADKKTKDFDLSDDELELSLENNNAFHPIPRKRLKKHSELNIKKSGAIPNVASIAELKGIEQYSNIKYSSSKIQITPKDDSDDEDEPLERPKPYLEKFPAFPTGCVDIGLRLKLLANVYLRKVDKTANIFLPHYVMEFAEPNVNGSEKRDFFRTPKGEICVFASGGLQNVWEKTVAHVLEVFNLGGKVKIIRATWMQKHLYKDKKVKRDIEEEFKGRETELHSEFYFDLFFRHFFLPIQHKIKNLTVHAYSWWEVCNECEKHLMKHQDLLGPDTALSYKIAASRRYQHKYPPYSIVENAYVFADKESVAWKRIWASVLKYVRKEFENDKEKELFWTRTKEGLEICKWLGQAFVENKVTAKGRKAKALKKGDVLKFYAKVNDQESQELQNLLAYLREKNWELSCWYKPPYYPDKVQAKWKKNWRQVVMPHFGWEVVYENENCEGEAECEMCGYPDIRNISLVFHPKFRVSNTFFSLPPAEQEMRNFSQEQIPIENLSFPLQRKKRQSLCVGSECVQVLSSSEEILKKWRQKRTENEQESKREELEQREVDLENLDKAEKEIAKRERRRTFRRY